MLKNISRVREPIMCVKSLLLGGWELVKSGLPAQDALSLVNNRLHNNKALSTRGDFYGGG